LGTYHLRSNGAVIDIINRRRRTRSRRGGPRHKRIIVWVSVILLLGLIAMLSVSFGASLRQKSHALKSESDRLEAVYEAGVERQQGIQRIEQDPSFLPMFKFFRGVLEDAEMYREVLAVLFKLDPREATRARVVLRELHPLYAEIVKYQDRVGTGDVNEALFDSLKALMQTAFSETVARICSKPLTACRKWIEPFIEGPSLPRQSSKPDVEI